MLPSLSHLHCPWLNSLHYVQNFCKCKSTGTLLLVVTAAQVLMRTALRPLVGQRLQHPGLLKSCASTCSKSCFRGASRHSRAPADPSTRRYPLWLWGGGAGAGESVRGTERLRETGKCCPAPSPLWCSAGLEESGGKEGAGPGRAGRKGAALISALVSHHPNLFYLAVNSINFSQAESVLPTTVAGKQPLWCYLVPWAFSSYFLPPSCWGGPGWDFGPSPWLTLHNLNLTVSYR